MAATYTESYCSCALLPLSGCIGVLCVALARTALYWGGDVAQEVRAVVWWLEGCRFDPTLGPSLSKTPNPWSWLVPCMAANHHWCGNG